MIQRHLIDIGFSDIKFFLKNLLFNKALNFNDAILQKQFNTSRHLFRSLSIRTTWDLFLSIQQFEENSEVIMSSITIQNMLDIVKHHRLVAVPIKQDLSDMSISYQDLKNKITAKTKVIVISHLFGSITSLKKLKQLKEEYPQIYFVEDCAQGFKATDQWIEYPWVDLSMISFGTIKSMTCLGGSLSFIKDKQLFNLMLRQYQIYPIFSKTDSLKKTIRVTLLKTLSMKTAYSLVHKILHILNISLDDSIYRFSKGFNETDFFKAIKRQLPNAMSNLMYRRLTLSNSHVVQNKHNAQKLIKRLDYPEIVVGLQNPNHGYWLFPIKASNCSELKLGLNKEGIDATTSTSQIGEIDSNSMSALKDVLYLPVHKDVKDKDIYQMANIINKMVTPK